MHQQTSQEEQEEQCLRGDRVSRPFKRCTEYVTFCSELSKNQLDLFSEVDEKPLKVELNSFFGKLESSTRIFCE